MLRMVKRQISELFSKIIQYREKYGVIVPYLGSTVLDLGCGSGVLIPFLEKGTIYVGADVDQNAVDRLRAHYRDHAFHCIDFDTQPLPNSLAATSFSSIVLLAIIEHLKNPEQIIKQCNLLMNSETRLIITTPTRTGDLVSRYFERFIGGRDGCAHPHLRSFGRNSLDDLCQRHGLRCLSYRRLGWHRQNQLAIYVKAN
jgi:2-polyprenyl-3-methyl-5-hydroxy-6-metoxy-1,4-benzoquinol methylase